MLKYHFHLTSCHGNMSTLEETPSVSEPIEENNPKETTVKSKKPTLKSYRQKLQAIQARIKYREKAIKGFRNHLKKGTFPKRFKSLRPFPKMESSETQTVVNAACEQVHCVILDQMILDEERKLTQDQDMYQTLKNKREGERSQLLKTSRKPRKSTVAKLMQELTDFQSKYTQLCSQLNNPQ